MPLIPPMKQRNAETKTEAAKPKSLVVAYNAQRIARQGHTRPSTPVSQAAEQTRPGSIAEAIRNKRRQPEPTPGDFDEQKYLSDLDQPEAVEAEEDIFADVPAVDEAPKSRIAAIRAKMRATR